MADTARRNNIEDVARQGTNREGWEEETSSDKGTSAGKTELGIIADNAGMDSEKARHSPPNFYLSKEVELVLLPSPALFFFFFFTSISTSN